MNLILLEPGEMQPDGTAILAGLRARHVREVLQAEPGRMIRIGVIDGPTGTATITGNDREEIRLHCDLPGEVPPVPRMDLLLAMPRPKVMNRLWPVLASLGVGRILVCNAWKTERPYFDTHVLAPEHIRAGLIDGLQQAGDTRLPQVSVHRQFRKLVEDELDSFGPYAARLVAHPGGGGFPFAGLAARPAEDRVLLAVGPEGGWTEYERDMLAAHGFDAVSWGPRILRTDTACVVLAGLVHAARAAGAAGETPGG